MTHVPSVYGTPTGASHRVLTCVPHLILTAALRLELSSPFYKSEYNFRKGLSVEKNT
jgi:hypothetical protein